MAFAVTAPPPLKTSTSSVAGVVRVGVQFVAVVHALAPEAFAATTATERRAAIRGNALVLDALRFAISDACWAAIQRFYGRG
jgi:hypothetical protein